MAAQCPFHRLFGGRPSPHATPVATLEATPTMTFTEDLKARTREQHEAAEHHPFHAVLFGRQGVELARDAYARLLGQHLSIQDAFEGELERLSATNERVRALSRAHHRHLHALRQDLRALEVPERYQVPLPATEAMARFIHESARGDASAWIGVFYVLEGSTNGGTIIAKRLRELFGFADETGTRYINPHGPLVRTRWSEWKQAADGLTLNEEQRARACDAAGACFTHMQQVLSAVQAEMNAGVPVGAIEPGGPAGPAGPFSSAAR